MMRSLLRKLRQRRADRRAEAADVGDLLRVLDGKAAADIERVEHAELLAPGRGDELAAGLDGLDVFAGVTRLRTDVERQPANRDRELARQPRELEQVFRIATELSRQVAHGAGRAERHAQQQLALVAIGLELAHLVGIVGDEDLHAEMQRVADVDVALDGMRVDAARRIDAELGDELRLAGGGEV